MIANDAATGDNENKHKEEEHPMAQESRKMFIPPGGETMVVVKGSDVEIAWTFDNDISQVILRIWWFKKTGASNFKRLAFIHVDDQDPTILNGTSLSRFEIVKPATLLLKKIDLDYTGTPIVVNEGENVTCLCQGQGGNIPGHVNVTCFKDGAQISNTELQQNMQILKDVNERNSGNDTCRDGV
ncbi:---NA--- [Paramuricea clavata]|uniref:---NA n=1 Tax=Paramuricea clavata TaxID=317549 RepID=A0A7D9IVF8_PARCT|nr:---NA--- [Paramuricea clavata]